MAVMILGYFKGFSDDLLIQCRNIKSTIWELFRRQNKPVNRNQRQIEAQSDQNICVFINIFIDSQGIYFHKKTIYSHPNKHYIQAKDSTDMKSKANLRNSIHKTFSIIKSHLKALLSNFSHDFFAI